MRFIKSLALAESELILLIFSVFVVNTVPGETARCITRYFDRSDRLHVCNQCEHSLFDLTPEIIFTVHKFFSAATPATGSGTDSSSATA